MNRQFLNCFGVFSAMVMGIGVSIAHAEPQTYTIDNDHTHVSWSVDRFGFTDTLGSFADVTGTLILDEDQPENSSVTAEIAVASVKSDLVQREDIIRGPFWLNVEEFSVITFVSTKVDILEENDESQYAIVTGDLTLHGVTAPATMKVMLNKLGSDPVSGKKAAGFSASGALMRSEYGISTALGPVGDKVSFRIEALAIAAD